MNDIKNLLSCTCTEDNQDWQCTLCARYLYERYDSWDNETEEEKVEELEVVGEVDDNKSQEEVGQESQSLLALVEEEVEELVEEKVEELEVVEEVDDNKSEEEVGKESQSLLALAKKEAREELIFFGFNSRNVKK